MNKIKQAAIESLNDYRFKQIFNSSPNMIHENDYKELNCVLCNKLMKTVHDTHCAFPLAKLQSAKEAFKNPENHSRCCSECNQDVMAERFKMMCEIQKNYKSNRPINELNLKNKIVMIPVKELRECRPFYETPQAQKRFKELGQNYYETDLGRSGLERRNDESSFSTKKGK
jgi:hypothetical protein